MVAFFVFRAKRKALRLLTKFSWNRNSLSSFENFASSPRKRFDLLNMQALIGQKKTQSQRFLENGRRIPVTLIDVKGNTIVALKTSERDHYQAVQLGFSMKKKASRAEVGHAKGAKLEKAPKFLKEVRIMDQDATLPEVGSIVNPMEIFQPGDIVDVSGMSKGKGFAGVVKRHGFHGGPKTHGQSDRHRAPGAIGQGTTPGRVYRGKRMAGRMGTENVTIQNLEIVDVTADGVLVIKGLVPGIINGPIMIRKVGEDKKFVPLWKENAEEQGADSNDEALRSPQQLDESSNASTPPPNVASDSGHGQASPDSSEDSSRAESPRASEENIGEDSPTVANNSNSELIASSQELEEETVEVKENAK